MKEAKWIFLTSLKQSFHKFRQKKNKNKKTRSFPALERRPSRQDCMTNPKVNVPEWQRTQTIKLQLHRSWASSLWWIKFPSSVSFFPGYSGHEEVAQDDKMGGQPFWRRNLDPKFRWKVVRVGFTSDGRAIVAFDLSCLANLASILQVNNAHFPLETSILLVTASRNVKIISCSDTSCVPFWRVNEAHEQNVPVINLLGKIAVSFWHVFREQWWENQATIANRQKWALAVCKSLLKSSFVLVSSQSEKLLNLPWDPV